jgi:hypothetical protein
MRYYILQDQIAGQAVDQDPTHIPPDFKIVEGPDEPIDSLYWDGINIVRRPNKPSNAAWWDPNQNQWVEPPEPVQISSIVNWEKLNISLTSSPEWQKAYRSSEENLKANSAFTSLLAILTSTRQTDRLVWAIGKLREAMVSIPEIGDFTKEEIASINNKLIAANFPNEVLLR